MFKYGFHYELFGILNAKSTGILLSIVIMVIMMYAFPAKAFKDGKKKVEMKAM